MPWKVEQGHGCPPDHPWAVVKSDTGEKVACHMSKEGAQKQVDLLYAKEEQMHSAITEGDERAELTAKRINDLPDSAFAYIEPGGSKDEQGKTVPRSKRHFPIHDAAHVRNALTRAPQSPFGAKAMPKIRAAAKKFGISVGGANSTAPPRSDLFRAMSPGYELRDDNGNGMPTLFGHFAVFDEWARIDSAYEGRFLERIDPASVTRTIAENRDAMRVLFQHGKDPQIGDKPLGPIDVLEPRAEGAYYEVPLIDTSYNRDLLPGLRAGLYGASYRFQVNDEHWDEKPGRSQHNPDGLPERTVLDMTVREFGPVTFPAYAKATAGVRSLTDQFILPASAEERARLHELLHNTDFTGRSDARSTDGGDSDEEPGSGETSTVSINRQRLDHEALQLRRIIT